MSVVTHPRIFAPPTPLTRARDQVDAWLESPGVTLLGESPSYWPTLRELVLKAKVAGPLVHEQKLPVPANVAAASPRYFIFSS